MARLNPNPRIEKLNDFRHCRMARTRWGRTWGKKPSTGRWIRRDAEKSLRCCWRDHRFDEATWEAAVKQYAWRHSSLWDFW